MNVFDAESKLVADDGCCGLDERSMRNPAALRFGANVFNRFSILREMSETV